MQATTPALKAVQPGAIRHVEFPLHTHTVNAEHVAAVLEALLDSMTEQIRANRDVSDGDLFQARCMALAIRMGMVEAPAGTVRARVAQTLEGVDDAVAASVLQAAGLIDDRRTGELSTPTGRPWRLVTDGVMGGVSTGKLPPHRHHDRDCLHLTGDVSAASNGGFVQAALDMSADQFADVGRFAGVEITVARNGESHDLHLRTADLSLPWQSYRARFVAGTEWHTIRLPFADFEACRTSKPLRVACLRRIGLVASGRDFQTDLCLADVRFYDNNG